MKIANLLTGLISLTTKVLFFALFLIEFTLIYGESSSYNLSIAYVFFVHISIFTVLLIPSFILRKLYNKDLNKFLCLIISLTIGAFILFINGSKDMLNLSIQVTNINPLLLATINFLILTYTRDETIVDTSKKEFLCNECKSKFHKDELPFESTLCPHCDGKLNKI